MLQLKSTYIPRLFLHYFDLHFLDAKGFTNPNPSVIREIRLATRLAVMASDIVYVPTASYIESLVCNSIVKELNELFLDGSIQITGRAPNLREFQFQKLPTYASDSLQVRAYSAIENNDLHPPFVERSRSATEDIRTQWIKRLQKDDLIPFIIQGTSQKLPRNFERQWLQVPEKLEGSAFIVDHVIEHFDKSIEQRSLKYKLHRIINEGYFSSYTEDLQAGIITDLQYLDSGYPIPSFGLDLPYKSLVNLTRHARILEEIESCHPQDLLELKTKPVWLECLHSAITDTEYSESRSAYYLMSKERKMDVLRSFIVHGHDEVLKLELKNYLQNVLHFPEPTILSEQAGRGATIIELFEDHSKEKDVAFVLISPDDIGGTTSDEQQTRARQNVIFELGYFVGLFGRRSGRVLLLKKDTPEIPSDLSGIVYINVSNGIQAAGEEIRRNLEAIKRGS